jgi:predicted DNA-binding transcriptional regulator AlpA
MDAHFNLPECNSMQRIKRQRRAHAPLPAFAQPDALLTAKEAAAYRRQGLSTFWRDVKAGTVPPPVRITPRAPRWWLRDLAGSAGRSTSP